MFPYAAIIASNLLNKKEGRREPNPPKISTLSKYTESSPEAVYEQLVSAAKGVGILEMADMICKWQGFDSLSDVKKRAFLNEYAPVGCIKNKPTIVERIKDYFGF